jgi:hypothetical protein
VQQQCTQQHTLHEAHSSTHSSTHKRVHAYTACRKCFKQRLADAAWCTACCGSADRALIFDWCLLLCCSCGSTPSNGVLCVALGSLLELVTRHSSNTKLLLQDGEELLTTSEWHCFTLHQHQHQQQSPSTG